MEGKEDSPIFRHRPSGGFPVPQTAPQPSTPERSPKPDPPPVDVPLRESDPTTPNPSAPSALFRALVDAGADAVLAYTADHQTRTMIESIFAAQLQPLAARMDRRFDAQDRKLAEHDRKLDVLAAQMRLVLGGLGLLVTVLIAVFGLLFTS